LDRLKEIQMAIFPKSGPWRIALLITALVAVLSVPYMIWGERIEDYWDGANVLEYIRAQGPWAAVVGVGLIVADLFVPMPGPAIMAALGLIYGPLLGGVISVFASFLVAMLGYGLCRAIGPRAALWIAGPKEMEKLSGFFERCGMWGIAVSRLLPWVPEILACLAGLSRMRLAPFATGSLIGSVVVGFLNAYFGSRGETDPETLAVVLVLPYIAIPIFLFVLAKGYFAPRAKTIDTPTNPPS
jgi:uncharacterized membrane protein YdjX (TVP38/TMEM64 family)